MDRATKITVLIQDIRSRLDLLETLAADLPPTRAESIAVASAIAAVQTVSGASRANILGRQKMRDIADARTAFVAVARDGGMTRRELATALNRHIKTVEYHEQLSLDAQSIKSPLWTGIIAPAIAYARSRRTPKAPPQA